MSGLISSCEGKATAQSQVSVIIEEGDFRLELGTKTAYLRNNRLELTCAEFDLLQFLLSHQKKLVTPRTILSGNAPKTESSVEAQSANPLKLLLSLRRKLDAVAPARHYLRTEPWILYSFNPIG